MDDAKLAPLERALIDNIARTTLMWSCMLEMVKLNPELGRLWAVTIHGDREATTVNLLNTDRPVDAGIDALKRVGEEMENSLKTLLTQMGARMPWEPPDGVRQ